MAPGGRRQHQRDIRRAAADRPGPDRRRLRGAPGQPRRRADPALHAPVPAAAAAGGAGGRGGRTGRVPGARRPYPRRAPRPRLAPPAPRPRRLRRASPPQPPRPSAGAVAPDLLPSVDRRPTSRMPLPAKALRIGRIPDNDLVLPDLDVSRHHAELRKSPAGTYEIVDLGSHNGTYVNGRRVSSAVIERGRHRQHRTLHVPPGRRRAAAVRRRRPDHLQRAGPGGEGRRRQDAAEPRHVPDPGEEPGRRHRPERRGQVDPARRADRHAPRGHRHRPVRQPRPVPQLRRAADSASAWSRRRASCTPSSPPAARCSTPPSSASPPTPGPTSATPGSTR